MLVKLVIPKALSSGIVIVNNGLCTLNFSKLVILLPSIEASKMSTSLIRSSAHCLNPSSNCGSGIGPEGMPLCFLLLLHRLVLNRMY